MIGTVLIVGIQIYLQIWKITWDNLPTAQTLDNLIDTNTQLEPGEQITQEINLLSDKLDKIALVMQIGTESAALAELEQGNLKTSATITTQDPTAPIMYEITLPSKAWQAHEMLKVTLSNLTRSKNPIGLAILPADTSVLRNFASRLVYKNEEMVKQRLPISLHYKDIREPILVRDYTNPEEILLAAWKEVQEGNKFLNLMILVLVFLGLWLGGELVIKGKVAVRELFWACLLVTALSLFF